MAKTIDLRHHNDIARRSAAIIFASCRRSADFVGEDTTSTEDQRQEAPMCTLTVTAPDEESVSQLRRFLRELRSQGAVDRVIHHADGTSEFKLHVTADKARLLLARLAVHGGFTWT